jgi:hypothetical protein
MAGAASAKTSSAIRARMPSLTRCLNRTVLVSIPALFDDAACRPYILEGLELHGLWLRSDELNKRLLGENRDELVAANPVVFVPFASIAGVVVPTAPPHTPPPGAANKQRSTRRPAAPSSGRAPTRPSRAKGTRADEKRSPPSERTQPAESKRPRRGRA